MKAAEIERKKALLGNQALSILNAIKRADDSDSIPDDLKTQLLRLSDMTENLFGNDAIQFMAPPPKGYDSRMREAKVFVLSLYSYVSFHLSDSVTRELIGDEIEMARQSLKQGFLVCAVLMCRVALEQTMRRLCDRSCIEHPPTAQPGTLAQSLRKENGGPLEKYQWKEIDSRLTFEGEVLHSRVKPAENEVLDLIAWTDKFIESVLS